MEEKEKVMKEGRTQELKETRDGTGKEEDIRGADIKIKGTKEDISIKDTREEKGGRTKDGNDGRTKKEKDGKAKAARKGKACTGSTTMVVET